MQNTPHSEPCCSGSCARADLIRALAPNDPIENDIDFAAAVVAQACPQMDEEELARCFAHMFDVPLDCQLYRRFRAGFLAARTLEAPPSPARPPIPMVAAASAGAGVVSCRSCP
ncbi:MAG: hypothetical protein JSU00_08145 [Acidobacteria bacterium]|nr:hypothetical protein [Acidobacteriota bacterium]